VAAQSTWQVELVRGTCRTVVGGSGSGRDRDAGDLVPNGEPLSDLGSPLRSRHQVSAWAQCEKITPCAEQKRCACPPEWKRFITSPRTRVG
jgi:hypothetical protein